MVTHYTTGRLAICVQFGCILWPFCLAAVAMLERSRQARCLHGLHVSRVIPTQENTYGRYRKETSASGSDEFL